MHDICSSFASSATDIQGNLRELTRVLNQTSIRGRPPAMSKTEMQAVSRAKQNPNILESGLLRFCFHAGSPTRPGYCTLTVRQL